MSDTCPRTIAEQDELLLEIYGLARRFAVRLVDEQDVDDLVHDVAADALGALRSGAWHAEPARLFSFVRRMVRHQLINMYRRQSCQDSYDGDHYVDRNAVVPAWVFAAGASDEQSIDEFRKWLTGKLPRRCREAYLLARDGGFSYVEVGAFLGVSVDTVETLVSDAHRKLRNLLQREGIGAPEPNSSCRPSNASRKAVDAPFRLTYVGRGAEQLTMWR